jgi:hypothetical protein
MLHLYTRISLQCCEQQAASSKQAAAGSSTQRQQQQQQQPKATAAAAQGRKPKAALEAKGERVCCRRCVVSQHK